VLQPVYVLALLALGAGSDADSSYLTRAVSAVELCRGDVSSMQAPAEAAAARLAEGGALWAAGHPAWVSELSGRAGGMMLVKGLGGKIPKDRDVVLFARVPGIELSQAVLDSGALVIGFGENPGNAGIPWFDSHAAQAGLSPALANVIPGWMFSAELVAALTRLGKMPVMFETIGLPGGFPRIYKYQREGIFWHEDRDVSPVGPGVLGKNYADAVIAILKRANAEDAGKFGTAANWAAESIQGGHKVFMYSMGHFLPDEIGKSAIGADFESGVWNSGFTYLEPPEDTYSEGDTLIHIGYQHPPDGLLDTGRRAGAKVVYVDILRHRDYVDDPGVLWIDPMWSWPDACVTVEGYDIPILPPSGIVNSAIAWEIHRLTREQLSR